MKFNHRRRVKRRVPTRERQPLVVPQRPNQVWSADFMIDGLYGGRRFRTFNVLDDFNREVLAIKIDTSITSRLLVRVFEQLEDERGLPEVLRTDNGPEFLGEAFTSWAEANGVLIQYIQPGHRTRTPTSSASTAPTARRCPTCTCSPTSTRSGRSPIAG
jgi:putative transposase